MPGHEVVHGGAVPRHQAERCRDDLGYHLSYLADALALGDGTPFATYVGFIRGFLPSVGVPAGDLDEMLGLLAAGLDGAHAAAAAIVRAAVPE